MLPALRMTIVLLLLALPATASAADAGLITSARTVRPGQDFGLLVTMPAGEACELVADGYRTSLPVTDAGGMGIRGRITRRAAPGRHHLALRCPSGRARTRIAVVRTPANRRARGRLLADRLEATVPNAGATVAAPPFELSESGLYALLARPTAAPIGRLLLPASPEAESWFAHNQETLTRPFRNGQCTDWAQLRRPDVVQGAYQRRYDRYGISGFNTSWDARFWAANAEAAGLDVTQTPTEGAVMVFQPSSAGAGAAGHVAIVEHVAADGSFAVSHMNAPTVGVVTVSAYGPQAAAQLRADAGIAFIP